MKKFLAVAAREIAERRFVFVAAAVASVIPFAIPIVRHLSGAPAQEARGFTALLFASSMAAGLALVLGASIFAGELANGRMGFYFSRPLSGFSIWAGKIAGAMALVLASISIVLIPSLVAGRSTDLLRRGDGRVPGTALAFAGSVLLLLLLAIAVSLVVRSRSALAFADLASAAAIGIGFWVSAEHLFRATVDPLALETRLAIVSAVAVMAALLAASYSAVASGRTDLRAAHRAFSATAWGMLATGTLGFGLYAGWVTSARPASLDSLLSAASPLGSGGWVSVVGRARGAEVGFLYDTRTGRFVRAHSRLAAASGDGRIAAWLEGETAVSGPWEVRTIHLGKPESAPANPKIVVRHPWSLFLSADGARLGILDGGTLSIYELPSGRSLVSVRICSSPSQWAVAVFVSPSTVRVFRRGPVNELPGALDVLDIDVVHRKSTLTASSLPLRAWLTNSSGDRLIGIENARRLVTLRDARTGTILSTLYEGPPLRQATPRFVSDGRIVLALGDGNRTWLAVFSTEGLDERRIEMGRSLPLRLGVETSPGRLAVARGAQGLELVDLDHGVRAPAPSSTGLVPISDLWWMDSATLPGSERSKLFMDGSGSALVRFDPATGERRVLLGRGRKT